MKSVKEFFFHILYYATFILMIVSLYAIFLYAPREKTMGDVQKIFYFHVPSAWIAFLAFLIVFIASIVFLVKKDLYWDRIAFVSAEIGVVFCSIVLVTGPLWAKPAWGVYWPWDARVTSFLVLWLMYVGYLMLREYSGDDFKRAYLSAVVGIIGFLDVPIVFMSIRWWRTMHPQPVLGGGQNSGLNPEMKFTFFLCLITFTILYFSIFLLRLKIVEVSEEITILRKKIQSL